MQNLPTPEVTPIVENSKAKFAGLSKFWQNKKLVGGVALGVAILLLLIIGLIVFARKDNRDGGIGASILPSKDQVSTFFGNNTTLAMDTDQTYCFSDNKAITCPNAGQVWAGQDAQHAGAELAYRNNGDGSITDLNTGLMWQQDPGEKISYAQAVSGASSFSLAGYSDWRLPTIKELYSLIRFSGMDVSALVGSDTSNIEPFIDTDYFAFEYGDTSKGERIIDSQWTTSNVYNSTVMGGGECFFGVNFADGRIKCYPTTNRKQGYFTIYVRGGNYGNNDFEVNGDRTVTDNSTGMVWQQTDSGKEMDWSDALAYCENLSLVGQSDWRLPNAKELQYIVDYSRSPDITKSAAIDPVFETTSIVNEAGQRDYPYFWSSTTHIGSSGKYDAAAYVAFGRALGYWQNQWQDVHGAGAQRSDPKIGDPSEYPAGRGPQGDAIRIYNYARCVRGGVTSTSGNNPSTIETVNSSGSNVGGPPSQEGQGGQGSPPRGAITACGGKSDGSSCSFSTPRGTESGVCRSVGGSTACVPN